MFSYSYQLGTNSSLFRTSYYNYNPMTDGYRSQCGYKGSPQSGYCFDAPSNGSIFPYITDANLPDALWDSLGKPCEIETNLRLGDWGYATKITFLNGWKAQWREAEFTEPRKLLLLTRNSRDCLTDLQNINRWGSLTGVKPAGWAYLYYRPGDGGACFHRFDVRYNGQWHRLIDNCSENENTGGVPLPQPSPSCYVYGDDLLDFGLISPKESEYVSTSYHVECNREASINIKILPRSNVSNNTAGGVRMSLAEGVFADLCLSSVKTQCAGGTNLLSLSGTNVEWNLEGTVTAVSGAAGDYSGDLVLDITYL